MLSDRRPILLANARIVDPSRDLDFPGDLLIADGLIREAKRGIGAAGVPEGTEIVDCRGKVVAPGLIDMRAFIGELQHGGPADITARARYQGDFAIELTHERHLLMSSECRNLKMERDRSAIIARLGIQPAVYTHESALVL